MLRNGERLRMTIVRDIRDRQAAQARIHHLAHHDALTGLPNRMSFMGSCSSMVAAEAEGTRLALLFIDLDHFKRVNDSLGHLVGDAAAHRRGAHPRQPARHRRGGALRRRRVHGAAARRPSREQQRDDVDEVARKLLAAIEVPVNAEGRPISVTPSIGVAFFPGDAGTPDELIKNADSAMYLAKSRAGQPPVLRRGIADSAYAALVLEGQLRIALERGEFELYFQPQLRLRDGVLVSCEALLRWNHPERGLLLPDQFIPVAERQRLMLAIGQWALTEAALRAALGRAGTGRGAGGGEPLDGAVPVGRFRGSGGAGAGRRRRCRRAARLIELELTERMLMDDIGEVKHRLLRLKAMAWASRRDDFGTGYSSLGHLKELPIDKIKIDRSFVHDLPDNRDSAAITRAIVQLGLSLGMTVTAEGVETEAQRAFLLRQGCDQVQGLLIGPPMPLAAFEDWARQPRGRGRGARLLLRLERARPARQRSRPWRAPRSAGRAARHGDRRAGADGRARAHRDRRHQHAVAAHVHVVAEHGAVLVGAVVVGGDAAGAVVDAFAHRGVAQVGEMVGLGAARQRGVFHLDEVADVHLLGQLGAGRSRAKADQRTRADARALRLAVDVREGMDHRVVGDAAVADHAVRGDAHVVAQLDAALEHAVHVDLDVLAAGELAAQVEAVRVGQAHAGSISASAGGAGSGAPGRRAAPDC